MDMSGRFAVIGMGQMGSGMAGRLRDSGLDVVGYDLSADQSARLSADGFRMTSNIAEALSGSEFVLTSLPDPKAVINAWLGTDGIVANGRDIRSGRFVMEFANSAPAALAFPNLV